MNARPTAESASTDDPAAQLRLGKQLLSLQGSEVLQAADLIHRAAQLGDAEAASLAAVLAAAGVLGTTDWDGALRHLLRAAELGWSPAQQQLQLLSTNREAAVDPCDQRWQQLHARIRIDAWLRCGEKQRLLESPRLRAVPAFASQEECQWLIRLARHRLQRARTYDPNSAQAQESELRTNSEADFDLLEVDLILLLLRERIATVSGLPTQVMELTKVLHYAPGQRFDRHYDYLEPSSPEMRSELDTRGQRLITFLLYLNDDYVGGETDFPLAGFRYRGRPGDALLFANVDSAGIPDPRSLHAGLPPTSGEKWLLSQWLRDRTPSPSGRPATRE